MIRRYDLRQQFLVNFDDREYVMWPLPARSFDAKTGTASEASLATRQRRRPTLSVETETVDTGERQNVFGWMARHVTITERIVPLEGSRQRPRTSITDGWYIDLELPNPEGRPRPRRSFAVAYKSGEIPPWPVFKDIGEREHGLAVRTKCSSSEGMLSEMEVVDLSTGPIDPALFELPSGFRKVEQIRQEPVPPPVIRLDRWYRAVRRRVRWI